MNVEVNGKKFESYPLRDIIIQGETGVNTLTFVLDPSETGYTWRVRGTINGGSVQSTEITPRETDDAVYVDFVVSSPFTGIAGTLYLTLVGTNDDSEITKRVGSVEILPDMAMASAPVVTQNLFEQLIAAIGNKAEDAEAWAVGTRAGVPVTSDDPAYQNNSRYYSEHPATVDAGTASSLPSGSTPTVENVGTQQHAVFNFGIPSGSQGPAATVAVGTVTTLSPGSDATVTNVGTQTAAVFNFGIPAGHDGGGAGTVTSVGLEATSGGGLTVTGDTITSSGIFRVGHTPRATSPAKSTAALYPSKIDNNGHVYDVGAAVPVYAEMVTVTSSTTLTSSHYGKMVLVDSSSNVTITLPTSAGDGTEIEIVQIGSGSVTIDGIFYSFEDKTQIAGQYGAVVAKAIGTGVWLLAGCLA